jgi:hypothetical protein
MDKEFPEWLNNPLSGLLKKFIIISRLWFLLDKND